MIVILKQNRAYRKVLHKRVHITERRLQTFYMRKNVHVLNVRLSFIPQLSMIEPI